MLSPCQTQPIAVPQLPAQLFAARRNLPFLLYHQQHWECCNIINTGPTFLKGRFCNILL